MKKFLFRLNDSIWFIPTMFSIFSAVLAIATVMLDTLYIGELVERLPYFMLTSVDLAQTILGTIAGALLTMTTITFSTIMVVLTTYSSQFSPRVLTNFITDKVTMRVLGIFMGGFVYSILSLLFMREASIDHNVISAVVGVAFAVVCLAFFAYFIHNVATSIQVSHLVGDLAGDVHDVIEKSRHLQAKYSAKELERLPEYDLPFHQYVHSDGVGYIQMIEYDELLEWAKDHESIVIFKKPIGSFVTKDNIVFEVYSEKENTINLSDYVVVGVEPSSVQDINHAMQKLVEIALRAISPGINDPNTAILCIRHLGGLLPQALSHSFDFIQLQKENGIIIYPQLSNRKLLYENFSGIAHYGREDIQVLLSTLDALQSIPQPTLRLEMIDYMTSHFNTSCLERLDQEMLEHKISVVRAGK